MFRVHRYLLIVPLLIVSASVGVFGQQKPTSIHSLPVGAPASAPAASNRPIGAPVPPTPPAPQAPMPDQNAVQSAPGAAAEETVPKLEFPNSDVKEVLTVYERLTGKRVIADNTVIGTVNITISSPVTKREAIQIIETNLMLNGFSLVPGNDNIIKLVGLSKNPRQVGVPVISDPSLLPEGDQVVTLIFKLTYSDPTELGQLLQTGYIAQSLWTSVTPLPKSQALMITESTPVLRGLIKIIEQVDIPPAKVVSDFITLERADVKDVLEKLEKVFEKPQSAGGAGARVTSAAPNPAGVPPVPGQEGASVEIRGGASLSEDSVIVGKIKLTADVRTNRIHVITRPINLPFIRELIHDFDSNIPFAQPEKRALKFVSASDLLDVVVKAITEPGMKAEGEAGGGRGGGAKTGQSNAAHSTFGGSGMGGYGYGGGMGSAGGSFSEELSTEAVDTTPRAVTVGNTKIIADPHENTIIVLGNKEIRSKVFALIDQIDVAPPQVFLNTVIGELSVNEDTNFGVDYILHPGGIVNSGSNGQIPILPAGGHSAGASNFGSSSVVSSLASIFGGGPGLTAVLGLTDSFDVVINALQQTGRFKVISTPMVTAKNNKKAIIASGEEIAVPTQTLSNVGNTGFLNNNTASVSSSVQYQPVELKLEVVPLINSDKEVSLDIVQTLNSDSGKSTNVGGSQIPTITTRYIKTNVSVPNRGTVVLGGLIKRNSGMGTAGIPLLGKIPGLGYLFRHTTKQNDREELVILIRPVVANHTSEVMANSETEQQRMMIEPDLDSTLNNAGPSPKTPAKSVPFRTQPK